MAGLLSFSPDADRNTEAMAERDCAIGWPCWADMVPEALAKIFSLLPLHDLLQSIPFVCSTWHRASLDAVCWTHVDLSLWCAGKGTHTYSKMLWLVVSRSQGCLKQIVAPNLIKDSLLGIIAQSGPSLQALQIPNNALSEECLCQLAPRFASITYLDIRGRFFSSRVLIESYAKHCPFLTRLAMDTSDVRGGVGAISIAQSLPRVTHLELFGSLSDAGIRYLVENCGSLEYLDLRGCWLLVISESTFLQATAKLKVFHLPDMKKQ